MILIPTAVDKNVPLYAPENANLGDATQKSLKWEPLVYVS